MFGYHRFAFVNRTGVRHNVYRKRTAASVARYVLCADRKRELARPAVKLRTRSEYFGIKSGIRNSYGFVLYGLVRKIEHAYNEAGRRVSYERRQSFLVSYEFITAPIGIELPQLRRIQIKIIQIGREEQNF